MIFLISFKSTGNELALEKKIAKSTKGFPEKMHKFKFYEEKKINFKTCPYRDSNPQRQDYKAGVLTTRPRFRRYTMLTNNIMSISSREVTLLGHIE